MAGKDPSCFGAQVGAGAKTVRANGVRRTTCVGRTWGSCDTPECHEPGGTRRKGGPRGHYLPFLAVFFAVVVFFAAVVFLAAAFFIAMCASPPSNPDWS